MTWTRFISLVAAAALGGVVGLSVLVLQQQARIAALEATLTPLAPLAAFLAIGPEETTAARRARLTRELDAAIGDFESLLTESPSRPRK